MYYDFIPRGFTVFLNISDMYCGPLSVLRMRLCGFPSGNLMAHAFSTALMQSFAVHDLENSYDLILSTDNGPQYISDIFKNTVKIMGIKSEYIQNHTPEDNGDIESFYNSLKTDYIWVNDIETFEDAKKLMEYAFTNYNTVRPHSSIEYISTDEIIS